MARVKELCVILCFSFLGELAYRLIPLPIPAGIYGLLFLLFALKTGLVKFFALKETGFFLLELMPLMFVAPGVGLMNSWGIIKPNFWPLLVIVVLSTLVVFAVTGWVCQALLPNSERRHG